MADVVKVLEPQHGECPYVGRIGRVLDIRGDDALVALEVKMGNTNQLLDPDEVWLNTGRLEIVPTCYLLTPVTRHLVDVYEMAEDTLVEFMAHGTSRKLTGWGRIVARRVRKASALKECTEADWTVWRAKAMVGLPEVILESVEVAMIRKGGV